MKTLKKLLIIIIFISFIFIGYYTYQGYNMYKQAINKTPLEKRIEKIKEDKNYIKIEQLPEIYINSVIAVEDHRFYEHGAIDIISIGRAIYTDIKEMKLVEGGSTITQQLAKNIYFTQEKKLVRKIAEIFMAFEIEENCNKDEILELYVNTCYFGDGYYNIKEASNGYFDKEPRELNEYEATLLAGLPNAPSVYAPTKNPELARQRQTQVVEKLVKYKYITQEQADNILNVEYKF